MYKGKITTALTTSVNTNIPFETDFNTNNNTIYDRTSNEVVITTAGKYNVSCMLTVTGLANAITASLYGNGFAIEDSFASVVPADAADVNTINITDTINVVNATDLANARISVRTGQAVTVNSANLIVERVK